MYRRQTGSALLVGIFITTIIIIIAIYLLEKIIPFSRDIKGIERGNMSYYSANTGINEALLSLSGSDPSIEGSAGMLANGSGTLYKITANGTILPQSRQGNSEYSRDWAIIGPGKPIQLVLKSSTPLNWITGTYFTFRIPDLDKNNLFDQSLSGSSAIINWALTANSESLQASGSYIMATNIDSSNIFFDTKQGLTLSGSSDTFGSFYLSKCISPVVCTLKLSLINPLILTSGERAPYIEYQAHFNQPIPLQTAVIEAQGYVGGFRKDITRFVQQMTTNEALDFTVFQ